MAGGMNPSFSSLMENAAQSSDEIKAKMKGGRQFIKRFIMDGAQETKVRVVKKVKDFDITLGDGDVRRM